MPIQKDVEKAPPMREELPPSLQASPEESKEEPAVQSSKVKTKSEKLWDIQLRKIRSSATRLGPGGEVPQDEKRYFEWAVDVEGKGVESWEKGGKWMGKASRGWVHRDTPLGKVMDLVITQSRTPRPFSTAEVSASHCLTTFYDAGSTLCRDWPLLNCIRPQAANPLSHR
ncbi:hypothetical protein, variant 2 [Cryptococcus amylolentus CBS 6039]|uniref:Uncharacterized protein n=1 Tax=Cryptococcus amylolentus CBS 6039 TaxID=1295533 RepID=A0A1E3HSX7_9TREE|nr:hypothetical protein, variant 2 [Cryptococcus amylolentus CBS 6039]ODN79444.1 hypothetical protein, variant 2 [Cryptococcus amylolentus CBS 6039]